MPDPPARSLPDIPARAQAGDPPARPAELDVQVGVVEPGSNLVVAGADVRGFALELDRQLSQITVDGARSDRGRGAAAGWTRR